jgi:hypothetical protein
VCSSAQIRPGRGRKRKKRGSTGQIRVDAQRGHHGVNDMATSVVNPVIDQLRRAVLLGDGAALTDGQLLESFVRRKDEAAFETLLRRHGPMALGVCRRVLRNHQDAKDAFQATFLILVPKAGSIERSGRAAA